MKRKINRKSREAAFLEGTLFRLHAPEAQDVKLAGDFNRWEPEAMERVSGQKGVWEVRRKLNAGEYQYKFVVDNVWKLDPESTITICNAFGTYNSVIRVP